MEKIVDATVIPLFTAADAERLIGAPAATSRRWLAGRRTKHDGILLMSFLDLVEVHLAHTLRKHGVPWARVIETAGLLRAAWDVPHPFAHARLRTDGRKALEDLLAFGRDRVGFEEVMRDSLFGVLDFRDDGVPWRLWPRGRDGQVVVDPARAFGHPVLDDYGVPVRNLAAAYAANGNDLERAARWFDVPVAAVAAAVRYDAGPRVAA